MKLLQKITAINLLCLLVPAAIATQFTAMQSSDPYEDVVENVKDAIIGRGLNISNVLPAGEMLNRTGHDMGYPDNVFSHAKTIEFCSAMLSHQLVSINPNNMVLCPFTISIYQLSKDDKTVYVTYRTPDAGPETKAVIDKVTQLIKSIVAEAVE